MFFARCFFLIQVFFCTLRVLEDVVLGRFLSIFVYAKRIDVGTP